MNNKNVVIATIVSLAVVFGTLTTSSNPTNVGDNEVTKVPTMSASVPHIVELPFLYSQKLNVSNVPYNTLTNNVQKDQVAKEVSQTTSLPKQDAPVATPQPIKVKKVVQEKKVEDDVETYNNVPLSIDLQRKISKFANNLNVAPSLVYAIMLQENGGNKPKFQAISVTNDYGMMQINGGNHKWMKKDLKEKFDIDFDWKNPYHSAVAATYYLSTCYNSWNNKGYSGEDMSYLTILSYNMGVGGASKYIKKHDPLSWKYVRNVIEYKEKIESGEQIVKGYGSES